MRANEAEHAAKLAARQAKRLKASGKKPRGKAFPNPRSIGAAAE